jgi:hypothetical protein
MAYHPIPPDAPVCRSEISFWAAKGGGKMPERGKVGNIARTAA